MYNYNTMGKEKKWETTTNDQPTTTQQNIDRPTRTPVQTGG